MTDYEIETQKGKTPVNYTPDLALRICTLIAEGKTLVSICEDPLMPGRNAVYKWLSLHQKFFDAYERAKELSAQSIEEEALMMARTLAGPNDFTSVKVQAYNIAMQQLRWSAAHRDKRRYGSDSNSGSTVVPITINTTLNLGQDGQPPKDSSTGVYTIDVAVQTQPQGVGVAEPEDLDDEPLTIDLTAEHASLKDGGKGGRPVGSGKGIKGRRKSAAQIAKTATIYAKKERERLAKGSGRTEQDTES